MMFKPIRSKENFLVFGSPLIGNEEIDEVVASMKSGWLGTGPKVKQFESNFKEYIKISNAIAVNSCTAALHLSFLIADIKKGDEVITSPLTFCATVNAIIHSGATPVLADIDPITQNIDPENIESKITKKTKAIVPVHFAGRPCEMDSICKIANENNLIIIEDCAHAIETEYKGKKAGTFGALGCFSFYVTKNVVTGEGGMIVTNSDEFASRAKILALHGLCSDAWKRFSDEGYKHYMVTQAGYKYNMMDLQAAIGIHQLKRVKENWQRRQEIWNMYNEAFKDFPIGIPSEIEPDTIHAYHLYTISIDKKKTNIERDQFLDAMNKHNIGVGVHYLSIPEHPYYIKRFGWSKEDYPNAKKIGRETISLPLSAKFSNTDVKDVINAVYQIIKNG